MTQEDREKFLLNENSFFYQQHILNLKNRIEEFENRIPNLKLGLKLLGNINDEENKFEKNEYNFSKIIKIKGKNVQQIYFSKKLYNFDEFSEDDRKYISKEYIDNYNKSVLEKSVAIDKYNKYKNLYDSIYTNGQKFVFLVKNDGTTKAENINIIMEFPEDIFVTFTYYVISKYNRRLLNEPIPPQHIPDNPLEKIESEKIKKELANNKRNELSNLFLNKEELLANTEKFKRLSNLILDSVNDSPKDFPVKIEDHKIEITIKEGLLHTFSENINDICIIPTKTGKFDVKVSVFCKEYLKRQEYTITFEVEDK